MVSSSCTQSGPTQSRLLRHGVIVGAVLASVSYFCPLFELRIWIHGEGFLGRKRHKNMASTSTSTSTSTWVTGNTLPNGLDTLRKEMQNPLSLNMNKSHGQRYNHEVGTWAGNTWIPPKGWQYYSTKEMQHIYANMSILWIGDSTARRAAATMYGLLNATDTDDVDVQAINDQRVIDINKNNVTEPCLKWANHTPISPTFCRATPLSDQKKDFVYVRTNCWHELRTFLRAEVLNRTLTKNIDVIIISQGIWEIARPGQCLLNGTHDFRNWRKDSMNILSQFEDTAVIWRTTGHTKKNGTNLLNGTLKLNNQTIQDFQGLNISLKRKMSYLDWGRAVYARSIGEKRIKGDIVVHFGLEPRLVLIQMITNRLHEEQLFDLD